MFSTHPHNRLRRAGVASLVAAATAVAGSLLAAPAAHADPTAATTLIVSANQQLRPVTHVASGSLYGLATDSVPADSVSTPLHANTYVQMAPGGRQLPNGEPSPAGDALTVARKAAAGGSKVVVRMPDWYPNFPYRWVSWDDWLKAVDTQVASVDASGAGNIAAYELWNEPDWTWDTAKAGDFNAGWTRTYREVRAKDPSRPIQGPSYSDNISGMRAFLQNAVATGTVPDIISWHELEDASKIAGDIATVTGIEQSLGISPRPVSIEEYGNPNQVGVPGAMVGYLAKFERLGVHDAEMAFWNHYGTLGDTLTDTGAAPNGAYWLYKWYGDMTGAMLTTTAPAQTGIDGAANLTADGRQIGVVFGGGTGSSAVRINGLNALPAFGATVHAKLEYTPNTGRTSASSGPLTISEADYPVTAGSVTVPVVTNSTGGYHLVITPTGSSTTLAGTYQVVNANSGLALDTQNAGAAAGTLVDQATRGSGADQSWQLVPAGSGLYKIRNVAAGRLLGIQNASTAQGQSALIWDDNGTSDHLWQLIPAAGGTYKIANYNSGLLLGVTNMSTAGGAQVLQWGDNGTSDHLWRLTAR